MKSILINLLKNGFTTSKKSIDEICKDYWELKQLFIQKNGFIRCNNNKFWSYEKRIEVHPLSSIIYFKLLN